VLVNTAGAVGAAAVAQGDAPTFEVAEELLPFLIGGGAVFLAGAGCAAAGDKGAVAVDDLLGIDGFVAHRGVDAAMADHELGDVGWHPVHDRVGDEQAPEVVWCELSGWLLVPVRPVRTRASLSRARMPEIGIGRFSIPTGR
jgi:hypothetical protein